MKKPLHAILALLVVLAFSNPAHAVSAANCYLTYHQNKDSACFDHVLSFLIKLDGLAKHGPEVRAGFTGFWAEIFKTDPQTRSQMMQKATPPSIRALFLRALVAADHPKDARAYAKSSGLEAELKDILKQPPPSLKKTRPLTNATDNDFLMGAYMASGNTAYLERILSNFLTADEELARDGLRIGMSSLRFGPGLSSMTKKSQMTSAICQKYDCNSKGQKWARLLTLSAGFMNVASLSQKDEKAQKTLVSFFEKTPRIQALLTAETQAMQKYLYDLTHYNNEKTDPKTASSLWLFENLKTNTDQSAPDQ